jgi:hypothetical protein
VGAGFRFWFETMIGIFSKPLVGMNVTQAFLTAIIDFNFNNMKLLMYLLVMIGIRF